MAEFLTPGVYVTEKSTAKRPLSAVTTSTAAIVAMTQKGPSAGEDVTQKPQLCTSWSQFLSIFGNPVAGLISPEAIYQFFVNGGQRLWVSRVTGVGAARAFLNLKDTAGSPVDVVKLSARDLGAYGNSITASVSAGSVSGRKLVIVDENGVSSTLDNISDGVQHFINVVNAAGLPVTASLITTGSDNIGHVVATPLASGAEGTLPSTGLEFLGTSGNRKGLFGLDIVDEVLTIIAPETTILSDAELKNFVNGATSYCANRMDCFLLVDSLDGLTPTTAAVFFDGLVPSTYASKYWPWITAAGTGGNVALPPSAFVAAKMSKIDKQIGVHQPAAGTDYPLQGVVSLKYDVLDAEQDVLNPKGINVLRVFAGYGPVIWGARTMGNDPDFLYNSVRRLFIQVEKTLKDGTKPFVFKPNTPDLRDGVQAIVRDYLIKVWRDGALKGRTIAEAFFVKCDDENNPPASQDEGKLIIQVGLAATRPAEFIVFEIGHLKDGASSVSE